VQAPINPPPLLYFGSKPIILFNKDFNLTPLQARAVNFAVKAAMAPMPKETPSVGQEKPPDDHLVTSTAEKTTKKTGPPQRQPQSLNRYLIRFSSLALCRSGSQGMVITT